MTAIDPAIAAQLEADLARADFVVILRTFATDLARLAAEHDDAAASGDLAGQRRAAHSLAGTAAGIGAHRLEAAARQVLALAVDAPPEGLAAAIQTETEAVLIGIAALIAAAPAED